jgi:hypothetical protein
MSLRCPQCKGTEFVIGPAREQGACQRCGTLVVVPARKISRRRAFGWIGKAASVAIGLISGGMTILDHIPRRVKRLELKISDEIKLTDHVQTIEVRSIVPSRVRFGMGSVVQEEAKES